MVSELLYVIASIFAITTRTFMGLFFPWPYGVEFSIKINKVEPMENSIACRYADFLEPWYKAQESALKIRELYKSHSAAQVDFINRKFWEWCAISQALDERSKLRSGKRGLGFAVGTEPLASFFAGKGCKILATDLHAEKSADGWINMNQHAASLEATYYPQLISRKKFNKNVAFQPADMRTLEGLSGYYDFIWSSCALEHLGTLQAGMDFVENSSKFLKEGGVAIHTTEFNVRSDDDTITEGDNVVYRQRDLLRLAESLSEQGLNMATCVFDTGNHQFDIEYDKPPYMGPGVRHLKLDIGGYVCTSFLLIIEKPVPKFTYRVIRKIRSYF